MSWLESLLSHVIPEEYCVSILTSLLETLIDLPFFVGVVIFVALCARTVIYYVWFLRCPGRGKEYDLTGKLYVVTGGTSGIGRQLVRELFSRNGSIVILVRNPIAGVEVRRELRDEFPLSLGAVTPIFCDLSNMASVRKAADLIMKTFKRIDGLVCNAGIGSRARLERTIDGFEQVIQSNCLSHALLTTMLSCGLQLTNGVVINVSSHVSHSTTPFDYDDPFFNDECYNGYEAYCRSKLMVNIFTMQAAKKMTAGVCFLAVYPGIVFTPIGDQFVRARSRLPALLPYILPISRTMFWLVGRTVKQGAMTIWPLLVDPDLRPPSGSVIDRSFRVTDGDRLNNSKMDDTELEKMTDSLIKAVYGAIDKFVNSGGADSPDEMEDLEMEGVLDEGIINDGTIPFSITRRLSKKKEKIVKKFKGFARRSIRRENSGEALQDEEGKSIEREVKIPIIPIRRKLSADNITDDDRKALEIDFKEVARRLVTPEAADVKEENAKTEEKTETKNEETDKIEVVEWSIDTKTTSEEWIVPASVSDFRVGGSDDSLDHSDEAGPSNAT